MDGEKKPLAEAVQEAAVEKLGVSDWDRPAIYRHSADAAVDNRLPFWAVLILSGGIATLGLAIDSSAVVIGAMLVAPLLAPIMGLALAMAAGDGRLAIQSGAVVVGSTAAVVITGAVLTAVLPFQTITLEIAARVRPSTLDLVIAIFSGLAAAVVTVARGSRLSAAIPGVAISVALIPPLGVAGFGIAADWNSDLIYGSMLLYGANLAGIVLSGMGVFLLVGMHDPDVVEAALQRHQKGTPHGLAALADRVRWVRRMERLRSPWARAGLVMAFVVALGIPLSESLMQIAREARVQRAIAVSSEPFQLAGRASILSQEIVYGGDQSVVYLRIATTDWFEPAKRDEFERTASAAAGEPIRLVLEQLPASGGDAEAFARLLPAPLPRRPAPAPDQLAELLSLIRARLEEAAAGLVLPTGVQVVDLQLAGSQLGGAHLRVVYAGPARLAPEAEQMLSRQLQRAVEVPGLTVRTVHVSTLLRPLDQPADSLRVLEVAGLLNEYPSLRAEVVAPVGADSSVIATTVRDLVRAGVASGRVTIRNGATPGGEPGVQLRVVGDGADDDDAAAGPPP